VGGGGGFTQATNLENFWCSRDAVAGKGESPHISRYPQILRSVDLVRPPSVCA
jgi:hypothetical protein